MISPDAAGLQERQANPQASGPPSPLAPFLCSTLANSPAGLISEPSYSPAVTFDYSPSLYPGGHWPSLGMVFTQSFDKHRLRSCHVLLPVLGSAGATQSLCT